MTRHVEFVDGEAPVKDAAELMGEIDVGALPVGSADRLEGILTDRDVLYRVVARGLDPTTVRVRDVASQPVIACGGGDAGGAGGGLIGGPPPRPPAGRGAAGGGGGWGAPPPLGRPPPGGGGAP